MQGARSRSPPRGLIEGTSYSIQAPLLSNNFATNLVQRGRDDPTKKFTSLEAQGILKEFNTSALDNQFSVVSDQSLNAQAQAQLNDFSAYNLAMGGTSVPSKVTVLKRNAQEAGLLQASGDDTSESDEEAKPALKPGKKTKGRVKIKMEFIKNKLRRYTTFSKRKTGIMKKAYELSTLTGTQVMLLVASETGHVYTFATRKLQPMITSDSGKALIQTCLNSPDPPPAASQNDQRMNPTGYEETELNYAVSEEEMKMALDHGSAIMRSHSPPSDTDDSATRRLNLVPAHHVTAGQNRATLRPDHYRANLATKDKRPHLHPRPRQMGQQQPQHRPQTAAVSTNSIASNGATAIPLQVSSALQMGMSVEGLQTDALGQPYLTIPLQTMAQQFILAGQRLPGQTGERVTSHPVRLTNQDKALDATKRQDRNTH